MADTIAEINETKKTRLDEETLLVLGRELGREFSDSWDASTNLRADVSDYRDQYESIVPQKPLDWQANIAIPSTKHSINMAALRISKATFGSDPIFEVECDDPNFDEAAQEEENYHQVWNERNRLKTKGYMAIKEALVAGQCWLKNGVKKTGAPPPDYSRLMTPDFQQIPIRIDQLDVVPTCDYVITEDMMLLPFSAPNFKRAKGAFTRTTLRWNDIAKAQKAKRFYESSVDKVKLRWQTEHKLSPSQEQMGIESQIPRALWSAEFDCWEGIYRWVKPGENEEREWLILAYYDTETAGDAVILSCKPYQEVYGEDADWFFTPIIVDPKANSMWGGSMAYWLRGLQNFINAMFSGCTDAVQLKLLPPLLVNQSIYNQRKDLRYGPLRMWPVTNPTDIMPLPDSSSTLGALQAGLNMVEMCRQMTERLSGQNDPASGKVSEEKRTAYEIGLVATSGDQIIDHYVILVEIGTEDGHGIEAFAQNQMMIIKQFLPQWPVSYKTTRQGRSGDAIVDPQWHQAKYRFIPHGNSAGSNPEVRFKRAEAMLGAMMQDPFALPSVFDLDRPDLLLEKIKRIYKARRDFYEGMGNKHPERSIGGEPQTVDEAIAIAATINPEIKQAIMARIAQEAEAEAMANLGNSATGMVQVPGQGNPTGIGYGAGEGNQASLGGLQ